MGNLSLFVTEIAVKITLNNHYSLLIQQATSENASEVGDMKTDEAVKNTVLQITNAR